MAFGPHRGAIPFTKGYGLPHLENGNYELVINNEHYGRLLVDDESVRLDQPGLEEHVYQGILETGIMAIGGETTGTILKTDAGTYELRLSEDLRGEVDFQQFDGERVRITGVMTEVQGVEIPFRQIIEVTEIERL